MRDLKLKCFSTREQMLAICRCYSAFLFTFTKVTQGIFVRVNNNAERIWPHHRFCFIVHLYAESTSQFKRNLVVFLPFIAFCCERHVDRMIVIRLDKGQVLKGKSTYIGKAFWTECRHSYNLLLYTELKAPTKQQFDTYTQCQQQWLLCYFL